jgi:hypothetical protein
MLPIIEHAKVVTNEVGRINIIMENDWLFYDLHDYETVEKVEEYSYSDAGYNYPINYDFSKIKVIKKGESIETEATEADYISALNEKDKIIDILSGEGE